MNNLYLDLWRDGPSAHILAEPLFDGLVELLEFLVFLACACYFCACLFLFRVILAFNGVEAVYSALKFLLCVGCFYACCVKSLLSFKEAK